MKVTIINGPNLNLLGKRETEIYGSQSFEAFFEELKQAFPEVELQYFQSNIEGEIVDKIQEAGFNSDGIVLNAAGYSHTSVSIGDAVAAVEAPVVCVHISNIHAREEFRTTDLVTKAAIGSITGLGLEGYELALQYFLKGKRKV